MRMQENGSLLIWDKLKDLIDAEIADKTASCVRMKTMVVTTAYDATAKTVGVTEAFGTEVQLPVCGDVNASELSVGESVWVMIPYSMSNAMVMMRGDGRKGVAATAQDIYMSSENQTTVYENVVQKVSASAQTVTLTSSGWTGSGPYTQTVNVAGVTADTDGYAAPDSASYEAYCTAMVRISAQGNGEVTFTAKTKPSTDVTVNMLLLMEGTV